MGGLPAMEIGEHRPVACEHEVGVGIHENFNGVYDQVCDSTATTDGTFECSGQQRLSVRHPSKKVLFDAHMSMVSAPTNAFDSAVSDGCSRETCITTFPRYSIHTNHG